jgi:hypothetical protein
MIRTYESIAYRPQPTEDFGDKKGLFVLVMNAIGLVPFDKEHFRAEGVIARPRCHWTSQDK